MSEYDMVDRLEKQIEGSNLALAAVAEVLQKMDSRLTKAEEEEFEMAQDEDDAVEKQEIIKAVASEVFGLIKADSSNPTGAQWGMTEEKAKGMPDGHDDGEKAAPKPRGTDKVQVTLQAMQKQLNMLKAGWGFENEEGEFPAAEENGEEEGDPRDRKRREEEEEDEEGNPHEDEMGMYSVENGQYPALEQMQKQIAQLTKEFKGQTNLQKMVQGETEGRLRKMGFREETSLTRPTMIRYEDSFGVDGTTPITKTADSPDDMVDQMMNMSYKDLRVLQERIESGETDGIPKEFIG
jgi:hypothetical protein